MQKPGKDIVIPISDEIEAALKMARADAEAFGYEIGPDAPIFPGVCRMDTATACPVGNMLRHTYRTVAADLGVDDLISHFLLGHAPKGFRKYIATLILANGPKMRHEQNRMSKRMLRLLGLDAKGLRRAIGKALARSRVAWRVRGEHAAAQLRAAQKASARAKRGRSSRPHSSETRFRISAGMHRMRRRKNRNASLAY